MDLADDVAYSVHDLEDGIVAGRIDLADLADPGRRRDVWATVREWYLPGVDDADLDEALSWLWKLDSWPSQPYDGSRRALGALKNLTSDLIGRFCAAAQHATFERYGDGPLARYAADLVVPDETAYAIAALKGVAAHFVMRAEDRRGVLARQQELVAELVSMLRLRGPETLEPAFRADFADAQSDAARLRVISDQVASLTDVSAVAWHQRLR